LQQTRDAHFNEFVQVAGRDGQELGALEYRILRVESLLQYPVIELQPGKMAVEE
jgi:hypothetical protein